MRVAAHTKKRCTPRSTQVQGPREEVRPLLLPFCVYDLVFPGLQSGFRVYLAGRIQVILPPLYSLSVIKCPLSRPSRRRGGVLFILPPCNTVPTLRILQACSAASYLILGSVRIVGACPASSYES